ncbi:MAG: PAS domain S-box protein [Campylobacterales bacterium]|nr:PAS domain S-box protein [Campylobacterales bacterium]
MRETIKQEFFRTSAVPFIFIFTIVVSRYFGGHLLFHSLAEIFSVLVGFMIIIISYYTYQFTKNNFLLYLGIGYFWIAILDLFHMLTFKGMMIYSIESSNITLAFWVLTRFLEALLLMSAPFVSFSHIPKLKIFILFGLVSSVVYWISFSGYLPDLFVENEGLTFFKIGFEYVIIALLLVAIFIYKKFKEKFETTLYHYIIASMIFTICSEFTLTFYTDFYGLSSMFGHLFKFLSYWMIFLSIAQISLEKLFKLMAHEISTYDAIPVPVVIVDADGIIRQANRAAKSFLNLSKYEIINHSNHLLFHNKKTEENACELCIFIKNMKTVSLYEFHNDSHTYSFTISPIILANQIEGTVQVCIDISELKNIEKQLKRESTLLETIINTVPISIFWKDRDFKYLGCNKIFAEELNLASEKDIVGKSDYDMPWIEEAELYLADDREVMESKRSKINYEEPQTKLDGSKIWLNSSKVPLIDEYGVAYGVIGAHFDITDRKNYEEKLNSAYKMLSDAERIGHIGSWEMDLKTKEIVLSDEVFRIFGEEIESFVPQFEVLMSYFAQSDQNKIINLIARIREGKTEKEEIECVLKRRDNTERNVKMKNEVVKSAQGVPVRITGIIIDTTEHVASEQELKKLKTAIEQSPVSIVITDIDGNLEYVNPFFTKATGYTSEEVLGHNPRVLASGATSQEEYAQLWNKLINEETWSGTFKNIKKNGEVYWESAIISPIKDKNGKIVNYIGIKQDISNRIIMEQELKQKDEMMIAQSRSAAMGEMISMIAHQWRQPISVISMSANNMLLDLELGNLDDDEVQQEANDILEQTRYLSNTIDDFRDFFKPSKELEEVNVEELLENSLKMMSKSLENSSIVYKINVAPTPKIKVYSRELVQVFINILKNAKEALVENRKEEEREITISIKESENSIIINMSNNGGPIEERNLSKIFDPYFSTKESKSGTGIGLYMSKMIIEKHINGTLSVTNTKDGVDFCIELQKSRG